VTNGVGRHRQVLQQETERHVDSWIHHTAVRDAVETDPIGWREGGQAALEALEINVGLVGQADVCWLMFRALSAQADAPGRPGYGPPEWADRPEVTGVANALLAVVTMLGRALQERGVKLDVDAGAITDRLVLAQLITLDVDWDAPDLVSTLNVGSVRWLVLMEGGVYVGSDRHGGEIEGKAIDALARRRRGQIRSYREREGRYDARIRAVDRGPEMSDADVADALSRDGMTPELSWLNKRRKQLRRGPSTP
jgi:hypothetical protein